MERGSGEKEHVWRAKLLLARIFCCLFCLFFGLSEEEEEGQTPRERDND